MPEPESNLIADYTALAQEMFDALRACTPNARTASVLAIELAAQVLSVIDLDENPRMVSDLPLRAWITLFEERFKELQVDRRAHTRAQNTGTLDPEKVL